jgi:RimJ/RimL family protein N-acetyltransferase
MPFPEDFTTARLTAERLTAAHAQEIHRMHQDALVMKEIGGVRTPAQTASYMTANLEHWTKHHFGLWILRDAATGAMAGRAVLRHLVVDGTDEVEVGYAFYEPFWGRGLATEITTACLSFGFNELGFGTIVAVTSPTNFASHHVLRKCGLAFEKTFDRDHIRSYLFRVRSSEALR